MFDINDLILKDPPFNTDLNEWAIFIDPEGENSIFIEHQILVDFMIAQGKNKPAIKKNFDKLVSWVAALVDNKDYQELFHYFGNSIVAWLRKFPENKRIDGTATEIYLSGNTTAIHIGWFDKKIYVFVPRIPSKEEWKWN